MFDECIRNKQGELASLHKIGQQKSVFSSERERIKRASLDVHPRASNGETSGVQVSDTTVWLKHVVLKGYQPQSLRPADQVRAVSNEPQLKAIVLGRVVDGRSESSQTVCLESGISVHEEQHCALGIPNPSISSGRNPRVNLWE
jgi:hypothetical protein